MKARVIRMQIRVGREAQRKETMKTIRLLCWFAKEAERMRMMYGPLMEERLPDGTPVFYRPDDRIPRRLPQ